MSEFGLYCTGTDNGHTLAPNGLTWHKIILSPPLREGRFSNTVVLTTRLQTGVTQEAV